jgi:hypothetical protein
MRPIPAADLEHIMARNTRSQVSAEARTRKEDADDVRGSRAASDVSREDDGTALSPEDRRAMIRNEFAQEALPTVPKMPGWHLCWLSLTNSYDPVHKRMRIGYQPVRIEEVQGFQSFKMTSGEFEGCISCNEMVLFKLPEETYQEIMAEFHHNMPREEEEALKRQLLEPTGATATHDSTGKPLGQIIEGSDFESLGRGPARAPVFQ